MKRTFVISTFVLASLFFMACAQAISGSNVAPRTCTVNFYINDCNNPVSVTVPYGSKFSDIQNKEEIVEAYTKVENNYFMFWSSSNESSLESEKNIFNLDTDSFRKEKLNLYAIYAPKIFEIEEIENGILKINLNGANHFPFEDDGFAGLKFSYVSESGCDEEIKFNAFYYEKKNDYSILTCYFDPLDIGTYTFKLTNTYDFFTADNVKLKDCTAFIIKNFRIKTDSNFAELSWDNVPDYNSYEINLYQADITEPLLKRTVTTLNESFYGLENNVEYKFVVSTLDNKFKAEKNVCPRINVSEPDWLVALYMDGDNNLNNPIWYDLNEVENGLSKIRVNNQTASAYDSVTVVVLWDGINSRNDGESVKYGISGSCLYELGADSSFDFSNTFNDYYYVDTHLSPSTKNLSYTARDWLLENRPLKNITKDSYGEVNMGSRETLTNYLNWINQRYKPKKGTILQFSNHGSGPRSAPAVVSLRDKKILLNDNENRKALCLDESSGNALLCTKDVSYALESAGFGKENKLSMIFMDLCLSSSIEDAYEFKDYADYLLASPSIISSYGHNYVGFMKCFTKDTTIENIGKNAVQNFVSFYKDACWNDLAKSVYGVNYADLPDNKKIELEFFYAGLNSIPTVSFVNLSKLSEVKDAVDSIVNELLLLKNVDVYINKEKEIFLEDTVDAEKINYLEYVRDYYLSITRCYYLNFLQTYKGTYNFLYDLGVFAKSLRKFAISSGLKNACINLDNSLNDAIVCSWRDTKCCNQNAGFYNYFDGVNTKDFTGHSLGLTICGANIATDGSKAIDGSAPDFYKTDLKFGADSKWYELLDCLFNKID